MIVVKVGLVAQGLDDANILRFATRSLQDETA